MKLIAMESLSRGCCVLQCTSRESTDCRSSSVPDSSKHRTENSERSTRNEDVLESCGRAFVLRTSKSRLINEGKPGGWRSSTSNLLNLARFEECRSSRRTRYLVPRNSSFKLIVTSFVSSFRESLPRRIHSSNASSSLELSSCGGTPDVTLVNVDTTILTVFLIESTVHQSEISRTNFKFCQRPIIDGSRDSSSTGYRGN